MSERVLFDTDVLIDASREVEQAIAALEDAEEWSSLAVSAVTQMELVVGCENKAALRAVEEFLKRFYVLPLNEAITESAVDLLREYRLSHGLLIPDALIAATALVTGTALITKNQRDYRFIAELNLLPYPEPFS